MRVGIGYDVHRLVEGRKLILGGVDVPFEKGLKGHSDADVLVHAICDALMGAAGLNDIGSHFPDNDSKFKDISSLKLLAKTYEMITKKGFAILNLDTIIFAEKPKLFPYRQAMQQKIAATIDLEPDRINIKATTTEGLGLIGRGEGVAAMCVALVE